jgi:uncharacterized membrane protein YedE/YeeE
MTTMLGGSLIGGAAGLLLLLEGRIAGVSGILAGALDPAARDRGWRLWFVVGLVVGGAIVSAFVPGALAGTYGAATSRIVAAGFLVGAGARLANGCTSGHGLCGVARGASRSIVAVAIFVVSGMAMVLAARLASGG